jgi:hypothetical protein
MFFFAFFGIDALPDSAVQIYSVSVEKQHEMICFPHPFVSTALL